MKEKIRYECIDAGSEYCPCYLAETGDCITCSHLQGKSFCDCNWRGVCIYQEYTCNGERSKPSRQTYESKILEKRMVGENLIIFKISVMRTLARQLKQPGSYIFIRNPEKPGYFDIPMSIVNSDEETGEIDVAVQVIGSKTKALLDLEDYILVRGPYWNGLVGLKKLKTLSDSNALIVARGVTLAPAVLICKYLLRNNNKITFIIDKGKFEEIFINDYIDSLNILTIDTDITSEKGKILIQELVKNNNYELCYSGGSDIQHKVLYDNIIELSPKTRFTISNNKEICCGEGICGSCSIKVGEKVLKSCKAQFETSYMVERGKIND